MKKIGIQIIKTEAGELGISQGYLSEFESGAKAGAPETLRRLASLCDVPEGWLV